MSVTFQKNLQASPYLLNDVEKAESRSISSFEYEAKRNSYHGNQYIAISPDGNQIVTLNTATYQLNLCKSDNLTRLNTVSYDSFRSKDVPSIKVNWSLAVSNELTLVDGTTEVLIAVSCYDDYDVKYVNNPLESPSKEIDPNLRDDMINRVEASTWIISTAHQSRISTSINNMGGIVKFLDQRDDDTTQMALINLSGITKLFIKHETLRDRISVDASGEIYGNGWLNLFFSDKSIENFYFPKNLLEDEISGFLIQRNLVKGRFIVESYKNKIQTVEMYNLKTNLLENTFQKSEESAALVMGKGSPCFAVSENEALFAYCRGANSITIYLMENGLEVTTKKFNEHNVRILFFDFVQEDSKLLIVIEEESYNDDTSEKIVATFIVVWDLFSNSDNCVKRIFDSDTFPLFPKKHQRLANTSGKIFIVADDGNINSLLEEPEIISLLNPKSNNIKHVIPLNNISDSSSSTIATITSSTTDHHLIYDSSGKCLNSLKTEINKILVIKNSEPWLHSKNYIRTSAFLDDDKSIQLIIGESTVQVWHKRSSTRVLKYIWTNHDNMKAEKHKQMQIRSLEVGHKEFSLTLYIPSGISPQLGHEIKLEWPEKTNNLVDACQALEFLDKKKNEPLDPKKQHQFEDLVQRTECIIKKYSIKRCGLWRMLDIRFNIMANLIRGNCLSIIKNILSSECDGKNKHLHIPRRYSWEQDKKETDLEIAIRCTEGGYRKDTLIVKYLLDYYSDNAVKTSNWMFTVAKAIPLLYEHHLDFYVKELFQKPCFGTNEIYLEQSNIRKKDMHKGDHKDVHALTVNLGLVKKVERNVFQRSIVQGKQSGKRVISNVISKKKPTTNPSLISQVYMVPLPDFIVYPEKINDERVSYWKLPFKLLKLLFWPRGHILKEKENLSPFLKMIRKDNSAEIYDNPSIAAVIDFKWNAARNHFLRHSLIFVIFAITFAFLTGAIKGAADKVSEKFQADFFFLFLYGLFYWLGFYLLNTERVQLKYDGWRRYFSLYNFFDLFSVILPLVVVVLQIRIGFKYYDDDYDTITPERFKEYQHDAQVSTVCNSFAILIVWLELFLLLRYFERAGAYIYIIINILKQITPFLNFILIIVFGFGHAMFVLLNQTQDIGVNPNGSSFKISDTSAGDNAVDLPYKIDQTIDVNSESDNYYINFIKSVESVFFWTGGRWDQLDQWDFWPVDVYSILGSILLVTILQNMLIAIMSGAYDDAKKIGRHAVLKYRAELIEDYETIEKPFGNKRGNPRYIYYIGNSDYVEEWLKKSEEARQSHRHFLAEVDSENSWDYNDDDDDVGGMIYPPQDIYSTVDSDSIVSPSPGREQETPLSLYWFIDEDENKKISVIAPLTIQNINNNVQIDTKILQDKIQSMEQEFSGKLHSMEETIKNLISLLQNQRK